jgi:hypothetical protein
MLLILLLTTLLPATVQAAAPAIAGVAWLQGCWESVAGPRMIEEQWMAARGGAMLGMSRTVQDGTLREYELVLIRETGAGLVYEAYPSGQPAATFPLKEITDTSILFEDPAHDFPQRIGYRRDDAERITAWIEGSANGQRRHIEYPYRRARCEP